MSDFENKNNSPRNDESPLHDNPCDIWEEDSLPYDTPHQGAQSGGLSACNRLRSKRNPEKPPFHWSERADILLTIGWMLAVLFFGAKIACVPFYFFQVIWGPEHFSFMLIFAMLGSIAKAGIVLIIISRVRDMKAPD